VAWIRVLRRSDGGKSWKVFWRDPGRRVRTKTFRRERDAKLWARSVEVSKDRGSYIDPKAGQVRFGDFFEHYLETAAHLKASSRNLYRKQADRYLLPAFGNRALASIAPGDVRSFLGRLAARTGPSTVSSTYRLLRRVLNVAVEEERIPRNPASRVTVPKGGSREPRFLTPREVSVLASDVPGQYRALVLLLGYGGLRIGEAVALRVKDIDAMRRRVQVRVAVAEVEGKLVEGTPKGGKPRTIRVPGFLAEELAEHMGPRADQPEVRAFPGERGGPLYPSYFRRKVFQPATRRLGLDPPPRVHDLRHTAVALAIGAGYHAKAIQEMLGHASITTTLDLYGHLFDTLQDEAADRLDAIYRAVGEGGQVVRMPADGKESTEETGVGA
jgi:integrase